jgi:hypothetical protein
MSVYKIQAFGYLLNVFQAEWSVISYRYDDGESVRHFSASLPWKIRNAPPQVVTKTCQISWTGPAKALWIEFMGNKSSGSGVLDGILRFFEVQSA